MKSVNDITSSIKKKEFLPIYFLCGEDTFALVDAIKRIEKELAPLVPNEFDKQVFYGGDCRMSEVLDFAFEFPFGSDKKLAIVKDFDKIKFLKDTDSAFTEYIKNPCDFTILILQHNEPNPATSRDSSIKSKSFFKLLEEKEWTFEARELKGGALISWIKSEFVANRKEISFENAQLMVDIIGEDRNQINHQIGKLLTAMGETSEVSTELVKDQATATKEYSIFDLQGAVAKRDKEKIFFFAHKLLNQNEEPLGMIAFFTKYFINMMQVRGAMDKSNEDAAAKALGINKYYMRGIIEARAKYSDADLYRISKALYDADLSVKSSAAMPESVVLTLMAAICGD